MGPIEQLRTYLTTSTGTAESSTPVEIQRSTDLAWQVRRAIHEKNDWMIRALCAEERLRTHGIAP